MTGAGRIHLLLGRSRWRRRRALPHDWLAGVDPFGRPTFLYLTDTWRKKAVVERDFRDRGCFTPPVRVLGELLHDLWLRHGDGRAILSARSEAILAERVLEAHPGRWPWLASLGPPRVGGEALARLASQLDESGLVWLPEGSRNGAELNDAVKAWRQAAAALEGRLPRARAVRGLLPLFERPPPALMGWLRQTHSVIVDDVLQPSPLRTVALIALCRLWSVAGAHVVFSLATGRDLGGREAGFFFEYDQADGYPLKPFAATRALRRSLFEALVASGEADIRMALADRVVTVEPGAEPEPAGPPDLSDQVYGSAPLPAANAEEARGWLADRVRFVRCAEPREELRWIARSVRRALDAGADPAGCVVAWPGLETEAASVRRTFADFQIPIALGAGDPVITQPVARALAGLPRLALDRWPVADLLPLADLCGWRLAVSPGELGRWCAAAGIRDGHPRGWFKGLEGFLRRSRRAERIGELGQTLDALADQVERLATLAEDHAPGAWRDRLFDVAEAVGLDGVAAAHDRSLTAWGAALRAIDELVVDLAAVEPGPWSADALADHLHRALAQARWQPAPPDPDRVQVVGLLELRGLSPVHAWLGGLVRGRFPRGGRVSAVVDSELARKLDPVDALAEARYLLHAALRNALDDPADRSLVLSWSATEGGRPLAPSPVLADVLGLPTTHPDGLSFGELVVESPEPTTAPLSRTERARAATADPGWAAALDPVEAGLLRAHQDRQAAQAAGSLAWSGALEHPPPRPPALSVTALETLVRCPARYWYDRVLGLATDDPWSPELEPRRRGTALHEILQRFVETRLGKPLVGEDRAAAAAELHAIAESALDEVEQAGGFEPSLQAWARARWLAGLVDQRPAGILAAWLDQELTASDPLIPQSVEQSFGDLTVGGLPLRGQLDRLDRHRSGALLVTDYKTGSAPAAVRVAEGLALQPLVYAEAAQRSNPGAPVAAAYLTLKRADDVRRRAWTGDPQALDALTDESERRTATALEPADRRALLDEAAAKARTALAGAFPTTTLGPLRAGCEWCPHARICRVDHAAQVLDPGVEG